MATRSFSTQYTDHVSKHMAKYYVADIGTQQVCIGSYNEQVCKLIVLHHGLFFASFVELSGEIIYET